MYIISKGKVGKGTRRVESEKKTEGHGVYTVQYVGRKKGLCKPFGSFFLLLSVLFCCFSPHYVTSSKLLQYLRWKVTQNIVSSGSGSLSVSTVSSVAEPSDFGLGLAPSNIPKVLAPAPCISPFWLPRLRPTVYYTCTCILIIVFSGVQV